ncbi:MAG: hypothetical protein ACKOVB_16565 [Terrabacter sp.]
MGARVFVAALVALFVRGGGAAADKAVSPGSASSLPQTACTHAFPLPLEPTISSPARMGS